MCCAIRARKAIFGACGTGRLGVGVAQGSRSTTSSTSGGFRNFAGLVVVRSSAFYSLSVLIISLSAKIHFENIFITKTNYIIASNKRERMNKNRSVIVKS